VRHTVFEELCQQTALARLGLALSLSIRRPPSTYMWTSVVLLHNANL